MKKNIQLYGWDEETCNKFSTKHYQTPLNKYSLTNIVELAILNYQIYYVKYKDDERFRERMKKQFTRRLNTSGDGKKNWYSPEEAYKVLVDMQENILKDNVKYHKDVSTEDGTQIGKKELDNYNREQRKRLQDEQMIKQQLKGYGDVAMECDKELQKDITKYESCVIPPYDIEDEINNIEHDMVYHFVLKELFNHVLNMELLRNDLLLEMEYEPLRMNPEYDEALKRLRKARETHDYSAYYIE